MKFKKKFARIFLIALIIRFACLYLFRNISNYDLQSYVLVGNLTLKGINIYPNIANLHHPYLPFFLYIEALAYYLGELGVITRGLGVIIIKLICVIFDLGILYLVYLLSRKNLQTAFFYAVNPISILITTLHGQFDVLPLFFILLSIYLLKVKKEFLSILSFAVAVLIKTWPILFVLSIVRRIKNKWFLLSILIIPLIFCLFYSIIFKTTLINIFISVVKYQGLWGIWGIWGILAGLRQFPLIWQKLFTLLFLTGFLGYSLISNKKNLTKEFLNYLFIFYIFTTNFSIQYFAWIVPFLIITRTKNYHKIIILISIYLLSFYYFWLFCAGCKVIPFWLTLTQNIIGFTLWFSFFKIKYLLRIMY